MIARMFKWCSALLGAIVLLVLAVVYSLYWLGLRSMPAEFAPTAHHYSAPARLALWRSAGGAGEPRPGRLESRLSSLAIDPLSPGDAAATLASLAPKPADHACR